MALLSFAYPNGAIDLGARVRPLPQDGSVPPMRGEALREGLAALVRDFDGSAVPEHGRYAPSDDA